METEKLPKILVVSINAWRSDSGIHTLSDIFKFWNPSKVSQIYTRSALPNTDVCDSFFQISESLVLKSIFNRKFAGKKVYNEKSVAGKTSKDEERLYSKAHKNKSWFMTIMREFVWMFGKWKSKSLGDYLIDESPDCIFAPVYPVIYMGWLQQYIIKKCGKPYVCYISDDNYSYKSCGTNPLAYVHRFFLRKTVKKLIKNCKEIFVISDIQKEETDRLFGTNSVVLTKSIDFSQIEYHNSSVKFPIKMVYTGKMIIGRESSLMLIADALSEINKDKTLIEFEVYSQDIPTKDNLKKLQSNGCNFMGAVSKEKVNDVLSNADILVFVESLEKKFKNIARMSFSTKITDYLVSGKCIFAVGDKEIAPIKYLKNNDAAIICTTENDVILNLKTIARNPVLINEYGFKAFECGKRNHDINTIKKNFMETMLAASAQ